MSSKVWFGRRLLNVIAALLSSCSCGAEHIDAGIDAGRDAGIDAYVDAYVSAPLCPLVEGLWRFEGDSDNPCGQPPSRLEYSVALQTLLDARICPSGCTCIYGTASPEVCDYDWSMVCPDALGICTFRWVSPESIVGQCFTQRTDEPRCDVLWFGTPR
jgi:hypothetical protein